jgi:predicted nucleic acid-binding protein
MDMVGKIFVDTNILLDVFAGRDEFYSDSAGVWVMAEKNMIQAFISAIAYNNIDYILNRVMSRKKAREATVVLRDIFQTVPLDQKIINMALDSDFRDFEDAIQYYSAVRADVDYIITRNKKDFLKTDMPLLTPKEFLAIHGKE